MKLNQNISSIPWYRRRWFWGVVMGALTLWGIFFYFVLLPPTDSFGRLIDNFFYASGATLFGLYGRIFSDVWGGQVFTIIYFLLMFFLMYKTFYRPRVNIWYPIIFTALFVSGSVLGIGYLSGL